MRPRIVAHRQEAVLRRTRDAEAVFHTAHHRDVSVPAPVHDEVPPRNQHQPYTGLAVETRRRREVHVLADRHAPIFCCGRGSTVSVVPGFRFDSNGGSMCSLS